MLICDINISLLDNKFGVQMVCTVAGGASSSIWLVIRVDRVLSSDLNGELYMKTTGDIKGTLKLQRNIQVAI